MIKQTGVVIMEQGFMDNENNLELLEVGTVTNFLSTWIEQGVENTVAFISSDEVSDVLDEIKELGAELSKALKVVNIIRKSASIPDKLFMQKWSAIVPEWYQFRFQNAKIC